MVARLPIIDPTKNVLDLVAAQEKLRDALRAADLRYDEAMRDAETRRIDGLAALRVYYDAIIEAMRSDSLKLLAEQLKENKAESGSRMGLLEQFRWESGGKGIGINAAAGWVLSIILAGVLVATYFKH
jgi:hypothetical protein